MEKLQITDVHTLAEKLSQLELTTGEARALHALIDAASGDDVAGFALQRMQQTITGPQLGLQRMQQTITGPQLVGALTGSGLFSTSGAGTELFSVDSSGIGE